MAAFREHITVSGLLGATYAGGLHLLGLQTGECLLAGGLCTAAGMLPDLDSDSGTPVKELFSVWASINAVVISHHMNPAKYDTVTRILAAICVYLFSRFVLSALFNRVTVHRGMWHSIPAMFIATGVTYLFLDSWYLAGGVLLGFLSHLVLDEIWSVKIGFGGVKIKSSAGSALKLFSKNKAATLFCWTVLVVCAYGISVKMKLLPDKVSLQLPDKQEVSSR